MQPDDPADDTPTLDMPGPEVDVSPAGTTLDKPAPTSPEVDVSTAGTTLDKPAPTSPEVNISTAGTRLEIIDNSTVQQSNASSSALKNHTSCTVTDHTSPVSPCSPRSADDNGEQKLSTPGAASSGYGSAVLTQTTSSDDLLVDGHVVSDDVTGASSCVVAAEVSIIDAAVPSDLDSPLKPTTPYTEEPAAFTQELAVELHQERSCESRVQLRDGDVIDGVDGSPAMNGGIDVRLQTAADVTSRSTADNCSVTVSASECHRPVSEDPSTSSSDPNAEDPSTSSSECRRPVSVSIAEDPSTSSSECHKPVSEDPSTSSSECHRPVSVSVVASSSECHRPASVSIAEDRSTSSSECHRPVSMSIAEDLSTLGMF